MSENQKEPQYKLRWSEELRDKVVESAKLHSRSINAEICTRLEKSFDESITLDPTDAKAVTQLVAKSMQELLLALNKQGVDKNQIIDALEEVAGMKKAP